ncbi:MAG TPA: YggS family pyridoxal phosphate enzyme [Acidimicrobiales bacterium]|nr:YggS family pyridoxal phosphate enzyme [Acidimicrobiales bacterium]
MAAPAEREALVDDIRDRLRVVHERIEAAGGEPDSVQVIGVTKGHGPEVCEAALAAGLPELAESYAQELAAKAGRAPLTSVRWHFVGGLQTRKVRALAGTVKVWQSVDRPRLVEEVARWAPGATVLVQVALSEEPGKAGCPFPEVAALVAEARADGLDVAGLMGVGPTAGGPEAARPGFRRLAGTARDLGLGTVSMGMSADLSVAVAEGATLVRVGSALFGPRPARAAVRAWGQ